MTELKTWLNDSDPQELRLAAAFLDKLADIREVGDEQVAALDPAVQTNVTAAPDTALAQGERVTSQQTATGLVIYDSSGVAGATFKTSKKCTAALIEILDAAPTAAALENLFSVQEPTLKQLTDADQKKVAEAVAKKAASFAPPPPKVEGSVAALFSETPVEEIEAAQTTRPADPEELKTAVKQLIRDFCNRPDGGFVGGAELMKKYGADRFTAIKPEHYPAIFDELTAKLA